MHHLTMPCTILLSLFAISAMGTTLDLSAIADKGARFVEYRQDAFWELGQTRDSTRVDDPDGAFTYSELPNYVPQGGGGIAFPNKQNFLNLGSIEYEEATGDLTGLDFDFAQHMAPGVFTYYQAVVGASAYSTSFYSFSGTVTQNSAGHPIVNLTSEIAFSIESSFDGTMTYTGSFDVIDNAFVLSVDDVQNSLRFETLFPGFGDIRLIWEATGKFGIMGDFDEDSDVDGRDFLQWQRGESPNGPINADDLAGWMANYGATGAANTVVFNAPAGLSLALPVPEPCSAALMLMFLAVIANRFVAGDSCSRLV